MHNSSRVGALAMLLSISGSLGVDGGPMRVGKRRGPSKLPRDHDSIPEATVTADYADDQRLHRAEAKRARKNAARLRATTGEGE